MFLKSEGSFHERFVEGHCRAVPPYLFSFNLIICIRPIIYIHFILTFILFFAHQVALELCKPLLRLCQLWYFAN